MIVTLIDTRFVSWRLLVASTARDVANEVSSTVENMIKEK